jgi:hypothetical protein
MISPAHRLNSNSLSSHWTPHRRDRRRTASPTRDAALPTGHPRHTYCWDESPPPHVTSLIKLQAAVARAARRHEPPTDCPPCRYLQPPEAGEAPSPGESGPRPRHSLHGAVSHSRLLPRRRRREYSQQAGSVGLLRGAVLANAAIHRRP